VPCGFLDPATIVWGRRGHAVFLSFAHLDHELVVWPDRLAILVVDSGTARRLEDTPYARRKAELLSGLAGDADPTPRRRARHLETENERVRAVVALLRTPEPDARAIGELLLAGHASLRDDFEVSTPELDLLVELAVDHGAYGARLTGAGFGGAVVALTDVATASEIAARILRDYAAWASDRSAQAWVVKPSDGAHRLR
jgi:galactokinase